MQIGHRPTQMQRGRITLASAMAILSDVEGFFPEEWRTQAYEVLESEGSDEQKQLIASKVPNEKLGNLGQAISNGVPQISLL